MSVTKKFVAFILAILFASLLGCAGSSKQESTGEYIDDTVITTRVKTALFNEPSLKSAQINVETFRGTVQLSGFVSSSDNINTATQVARSVPGVTSVRNSMILR